MKKKTFRPLWIVSVSVVLVAAGYWSYLKACADVESVNWYSSMFAPEMTLEKGKEPLFRSMMQFYDIYQVENNVGLFDDVNLKEWQKFFNQQVKPADISYLLYKATLGEIDTAIFHLKSSSFPLTPRLMLNSLMKYANATDAKDFLFYAGYARRCEPYVTYDPNYWSSEDQSWRLDSDAIGSLVQGGKKMIGVVKNDFIRERYFFQVVRLLFMQGDYQECINYYMANKDLVKSGNTIQFRAIGYLAGAYRRTGNVAKANHLYSVVYDRCPTMRLSAYMSFRPNDETDWQESLAMARTPREKCVLWQMMGVQNDPLRAMQQIASIDPSSDLLDLLLVRMVNMAEEQFLEGIWDYYAPSQEQQIDYTLANKKVDEDFYRFVITMADGNIVANPLLWKLSAGYLSLVKGNGDKAFQYLSLVSNDVKATPLMKQQARLLQLVGDIDRAELPDNAFELRITPELKWLKSTGNNEKLRSSYAFQWCMNRLAQKQLVLGNQVKAQVLNRQTSPQFYCDASNSDRMIAFMDNPAKSDFDKFILSVYPHSKKDIVEFQSICLFYDNRLADALAKLNEVTDAGNRELLGDPFVIHINDCHDCDHMTEHVSYTQRSFIAQMLAYEKQIIEKPEKAADYSFKLANGFYNATYFGNARVFYETPLVNWGYYEYWTGKYDNMNQKILDCQLAMDYYQKALTQSCNKEFKAKCCFMAAKCEQNGLYMSNALADGEDFRSGKYFRELKNEYSKTSYYRQVINECKYFNTFVRQ
jgi:hypothetical protein